MNHSPNNNQRCGFAALIGIPNAGKSTLVNQLTGYKVSIVTPKAQTTRFNIRGIYTQNNSQVVLVDTPGIFVKANNRFEQSIKRAPSEAVAEADILVFLLDVTRLTHPGHTEILNLLRQEKQRPCWLVLNKIDTIEKKKLLPIVAQLQQENPAIERFFLISAKDNSGVEDLRKALAEAVPENPWHYPEDQLSDLPERLFAAEITREQLFLQLHQEIPYGLEVITESWENFDNGAVKIHQLIVIERSSHKAIVLGKQGQQLKKIGETARQELMEAFGHPVHLFLHIKIKEDWKDRPESLPH